MDEGRACELPEGYSAVREELGRDQGSFRALPHRHSDTHARAEIFQEGRPGFAFSPRGAEASSPMSVVVDIYML